MCSDVNTHNKTDSLEKKIKFLIIAFILVFVISTFATIALYYGSYLDGNAGNIPVVVTMLMIIVIMLLIPPAFVYFKRNRLPTWLIVSTLLVMFGLWGIGFDVFALLIFPIVVDLFILAAGTQKIRALGV